MVLIGSYLKDGDGRDILENLKIEFKQFCFTTVSESGDKIFTYEDIEKYIDGNYETLKEKTKNTMITYMEKYVKKYFTTFGNTEDIDEGHFYIGVEDDGKLSGIPFFDTMENMKKIIFDNLFKNIYKILVFQFGEKADEYLAKIKPSIKLEFTKLEDDSILLDDIIPKIQEDYEAEKIEFDKAVRDYKKVRKTWSDLVTYEKRSIRIMINEEESRAKLIKYIESYTMEDYLMFFEKNIKNRLNEYSEEEADDIMNKYNSAKDNLDIVKIRMISKLVSSGKIHFDKDEIVLNRYNPYHYSFWNSQYKDVVVDSLMPLKPEKKYFTPPNPPSFIVKNDFSLLSKRIIEKGKSSFFYIKITFPTRSTLEDLGFEEDLFYFVNGRIKSRIRQVSHDGSPCCL